MITRRFALGAGLAALALPAAHAAAPQRGGQVAGWYRFKVGAFECTVVSDGALNLGPAHPTFAGAAATAAEVDAVLRTGFQEGAPLRADLNCLVVNTGSQVILLDCGVGPQPAFGPGSGRLPQSLAAAGIAPAEVDIVAFTHAHADHAWGVADAAGNDVFPNARFVMTAADFDFWTAEANLSLPEPLRSLVAGTRTSLLPRRARFSMTAPNADLVAGIRAVAAPGHTIGHTCYLIENGGQRLLVTGDLANHAVIALARPDWSFAFDSDPALASASRRRVLGMAAADRVQVLGYHFPWPGLAHVEARGQGFAFIPSPWNWG